MKPKEFIGQVLINEIEVIVTSNIYLSFSLICIGIEFLGKCLDCEHGWNFYKSGLPEEQFNNALNKLFDKEYSNKELNLVSNLRNGFCHAFLPKKNIILISKKDANILNLKHLENINNQFILIAENLFEDFKKACTIIVNKSFNKQDKMNDEFLKTGRDYTEKEMIKLFGSFKNTIGPSSAYVLDDDFEI